MKENAGTEKDRNVETPVIGTKFNKNGYGCQYSSQSKRLYYSLEWSIKTVMDTVQLSMKKVMVISTVVN